MVICKSLSNLRITKQEVSVPNAGWVVHTEINLNEKVVLVGDFVCDVKKFDHTCVGV